MILDYFFAPTILTGGIFTLIFTMKNHLGKSQEWVSRVKIRLTLISMSYALAPTQAPFLKCIQTMVDVMVYWLNKKSREKTRYNQFLDIPPYGHEGMVHMKIW